MHCILFKTVRTSSNFFLTKVSKVLIYIWYGKLKKVSILRKDGKERYTDCGIKFPKWSYESILFTYLIYNNFLFKNIIHYICKEA